MLNHILLHYQLDLLFILVLGWSLWLCTWWSVVLQYPCQWALRNNGHISFPLFFCIVLYWRISILLKVFALTLSFRTHEKCSISKLVIVSVFGLAHTLLWICAKVLFWIARRKCFSHLIQVLNYSFRASSLICLFWNPLFRIILRQYHRVMFCGFRRRRLSILKRNSPIPILLFFQNYRLWIYRSGALLPHHQIRLYFCWTLDIFFDIPN